MMDIDKKIEEWQKKNMEETGQILYTLNRDTIQFLIEGSKMGMEKGVLANYANISYNTLRQLLDRCEGLDEELKSLRDNPKTLATKNIYGKLEQGDVDTSKWYLEKKQREEFGNKQTVENLNIDVTDTLTEEEKEEIKKQLKGE